MPLPTGMFPHVQEELKHPGIAFVSKCSPGSIVTASLSDADPDVGYKRCASVVDAPQSIPISLSAGDLQLAKQLGLELKDSGVQQSPFLAASANPANQHAGVTSDQLVAQPFLYMKGKPVAYDGNQGAIPGHVWMTVPPTREAQELFIPKRSVWANGENNSSSSIDTAFVATPVTGTASMSLASGVTATGPSPVPHNWTTSMLSTSPFGAYGKPSDGAMCTSTSINPQSGETVCTQFLEPMVRPDDTQGLPQPVAGALNDCALSSPMGGFDASCVPNPVYTRNVKSSSEPAASEAVAAPSTAQLSMEAPSLTKRNVAIAAAVAVTAGLLVWHLKRKSQTK